MYICIHRRSRETLGLIIERVNNLQLTVWLVGVQREEWHEKKERGAWCEERATVLSLSVFHATPQQTERPEEAITK